MNPRIIVCFISVILLLIPELVYGQHDSQSTSGQHLYRPKNTQKPDSLRIDTGRSMDRAEPKLDSVAIQTQAIVINQDSINLRLRFIEDSLQRRRQFIQDSLLAREIFVRDSIARRLRILDSLNILKTQLPRLLDASLKAFSDQIIFRSHEINIIGDSILTDYICDQLTTDFASPYTPWQSKINLSTHPPVINFHEGTKSIKAISSPQFSCTYIYPKRKDILVLSTKSSIVTSRSGKLYKEPIDSVFFNQRGQVSRIKKYFQYYALTNGYQRGARQFSFLAFEKKFTHNKAGRMVAYELTKYCRRQMKNDPVKVCNIIEYTIVPGSSVYKISRNNIPANTFSDGTFTYVFKQDRLEHVSFENYKKTEAWKTIIEVNDEGNVSRYLYDVKGKINKTLLVEYNDNPQATHKVVTITCIFEDDGISYYQKNNMTNKSRSRDKMTLEWSDWQ